MFTSCMRQLISVLILTPICVCAQIKTSDDPIPDFLLQPILNQTEESISLKWGEPCGGNIIKEGDYSREVSWKRRSGGEEYNTRVTFPIKKGDDALNLKNEMSTAAQISKRSLKKQLDLKWSDKEVEKLVKINFGDKIFRWNPGGNNFVCNEERLHQLYYLVDKGRSLRISRGAVGAVNAEANAK